jgi:hypothetical protein
MFRKIIKSPSVFAVGDQVTSDNLCLADISLNFVDFKKTCDSDRMVVIYNVLIGFYISF